MGCSHGFKPQFCYLLAVQTLERHIMLLIPSFLICNIDNKVNHTVFLEELERLQCSVPQTVPDDITHPRLILIIIVQYSKIYIKSFD